MLSHSQNFLRSMSLVRKLIRSSSLTSDDIVLDVGAGKGIITSELARRVKRVEAIEKDIALCEVLDERFRTCQNVVVHCADFLDFELPAAPYKVFANIPFTSTTRIIKK